jgi:hypothetical protein
MGPVLFVICLSVAPHVPWYAEHAIFAKFMAHASTGPTAGADCLCAVWGLGCSRPNSGPTYKHLCVVWSLGSCRYLAADPHSWEVPLPEPGFDDNAHMKCPRVIQEDVRTAAPRF